LEIPSTVFRFEPNLAAANAALAKPSAPPFIVSY